METAIIILLLILISIPVSLNGPRIKERILTIIKWLKTSPGKAINDVLTELSYKYYNTSNKKNTFIFMLDNIKIGKCIVKIYNVNLLFIEFVSPYKLPFSITRIKKNMTPYINTIEKKIKINIEETFVFNNYGELHDVELQDYIFLLPEIVRNILNKIINQSDVIILKDNTVKLIILPDAEIQNLSFFDNLIIDTIDLLSKLQNKQDLVTNILNNINSDSNPEIRRINLEAFYNICKDKDKVKKVLLRSLKDKYWQPAISAAKLLGDEAQDYIIDFLNHPVILVKIEAIHSLKKINDKIRNIIIKLLINEESDDFKTGIFNVLTKLKEIKSYKEINTYLAGINYFESYKVDYCISIIHYLKMSKQLSAVGILNKIKKHPNHIVSLEAELAIEELKKEYNNDIDGWLSVVDNSSPAGSLSLMKSEAGRLSLTKKEDGE